VIVADASVLIAFCDPDDPHHRAAVDLVAEAEPPLWVHPLTLAEVLVAPTRRGTADAVWDDLRTIGVEVDHTPIDPMALARIRVRSGCRMPDCYVLASASGLDLEVATFDERLRREAAALRRDR
jgi:predicted nucleic acid-binding protein